MKNSIKLLGALLLGAIAGTASAAPLVGDLGLTLAFGGTVSVNTATDTVTFSAGNNSEVNIATGDYLAAGLGGMDASYVTFVYTNPFDSMVVFSGTGFSFELNSISEIEEADGGAGVFLQGVGTMTVTGYDPTVGSWSFSSDSNENNPALFNFSSTVTTPLNVPDGGTTALLLGVGLVSMSFLARRKSA